MKLSALQQAVLDAFKAHGDMTDEQLTTLPEFSHRHPGTVWRRRSDLFRMKFLIWKGEAKNARQCWMAIWGLPPQ